MARPKYDFDLGIIGGGAAGLTVAKEIFSLDRLPRSMIILGAGPIAIEMAQAFCRLGTNVSVIQRSGQILTKKDKDLADEVLQTMRSEGVAFHLNTAADPAGRDIL